MGQLTDEAIAATMRPVLTGIWTAEYVRAFAASRESDTLATMAIHASRAEDAANVALCEFLDQVRRKPMPGMAVRAGQRRVTNRRAGMVHRRGRSD